MKFRQIFKIWAVVLTIAGSFLLPVSCMPAYGLTTDPYPAVSGSPISMEVSCGYDGNAKSGRYVPVDYKLTNKSETLFKGSLRVKTMEADNEIYEYDYPVSIEAAGETEETLNIPVGRADILYVKLLDPQEKELISKRIRLNTPQDIAELYVGVLSDEPEKLTYLNGVGVNYSSLKIKMFEMKEENMPDYAIGLDLFDVFVITDYDTRKLSKDQIAAIWEWVKGGGTLLLGTGSRPDDTLYAFRSDILEETYTAPEEKSVDMGVEYATNGPGDSFMQLVCTDVSLKRGTEVLSNDEFPVLTSMTKGKGLIGVAAYDFVDIASFCKVQRSYVDKLFTALLGEDRLNNLASNFYSGNSGQFWSVQNMLNTGNVDKLPNLYLYIIVILGYILVVGPGVYLILKKQELRRFYRICVLAMSLLFTVVVYLMGIRTRFKDTFFTYAAIMETTENAVEEYNFINMRTPNNKAYTISMDPSYELLPITKSSSNEMRPAGKMKGNEDYKVRIFKEEKDTSVSVQNTSAFTPNYFALRKKMPNTNHIGIIGNVTLFEGKASGTVTNEFPFSVEKVGILMYGKMVLIEELKPGQTMNLEGLPVINYPINNYELVAARVTGSYQYAQADIENPDYMRALSRTNILSFYLNKYSAFYNPEARIVAFSKDQTNHQFLTRGNYETYGMTMFTSMLNVNMERGDRTFRSALMKIPKVVSGQYYAESNAIYGVDPVTLEYFLGNDLKMEKLTFENPSDEFLNSNGFYYTNMFKGNIYFYNHDTGNYDDMDSNKKVYFAKELAPYLSPGNTLTVKYACDNMEDNNWYVTLPMLTVVGRDK